MVESVRLYKSMCNPRKRSPMGVVRILTAFLAAMLFSVAAGAEVTIEEVTIAETGIAGRFYLPPAGATKRPAVLMLAGSDGGYPSARAATDLAASGHPVLALAYASGFAAKIEGLPARLERVPLEYGERAIGWLKSRLGPKPKVVLIGESRGAEFALLLASHAKRIDGLVAFSPSSVAWPAVGDRSGQVPAWTLRGQAVPFLDLPVADPIRQFVDGLDDRQKTATASIRIEQADCPVLLFSSRSDAIWPASRMADQIVDRLAASGYGHSVQNIQFDDASHLLMGPGPGLVHFTRGTFSVHFGGSEAGTLAAREAAWAETKRFLARLAD